MKAGSRWKSAVCDTEVIVVRAPDGDVDLRCGGHKMVELGAEVPEGLVIDDDRRGGALLGKRYVEEGIGLEVLCTKAGEGTIAVGEEALSLKEAKALPASD